MIYDTQYKVYEIHSMIIIYIYIYLQFIIGIFKLMIYDL